MLFKLETFPRSPIGREIDMPSMSNFGFLKLRKVMHLGVARLCWKR
jgi:hypothetical protein